LQGAFGVKITRNRTEKFKELWDKAFQKVRFVSTTEGLGFMPQKKTETFQLDPVLAQWC